MSMCAIDIPLVDGGDDAKLAFFGVPLRLPAGQRAYRWSQMLMGFQ